MLIGSEVRSAVILHPQSQMSKHQLCVHELIAAQAQKTPDAIALVAGGKDSLGCRDPRDHEIGRSIHFAQPE